jgi:hypothetical protein
MDGQEIMEKGFFVGYNAVVWTAIVFQAFGGLVVALCVNYADNIAKNFATSISIIASCIASVYFFDFVVTINVGSSLLCSPAILILTHACSSLSVLLLYSLQHGCTQNRIHQTHRSLNISL